MRSNECNTELPQFGKYAKLLLVNLKEDGMRQILTVSKRGQITLPAGVRSRLGIREGGIVIVEEENNTLTLRPAAAVEVENYSDEDIRQWEEEDRLGDGERAAILQAVKRG